MPNPVTFGLQPTVLPRRSGFDKSFKNLLTAKVGTLVPVLCDPVIPGTRVDLRAALKLAMPPLASDTFMNLRLKQEVFFVPASSCYGGFNDFITKRDIMSPSGDTVKKAILPYIDLDYITRNYGAGAPTLLSKGYLADYLGMQDLDSMNSPADKGLLPKLNALPFIGYHRIYDRYYRNSRIQKPLFQRKTDKSAISGADFFTAGQLPYLTFVEGEEFYASITDTAPVNPDFDPDVDPLDPPPGYDPDTPEYLDGNIKNIFSYEDDEAIADLFQDGITVDPFKGLFHLRQRNYGADYFTTATPTPQKGDPSVVSFVVDGQGEGEISIAAVRAANAFQIFRERNNFIDDNIHAYNRAHYNVNRTGYGESLPQFLGQAVTSIYTDAVNQAAQDSSQQTTNNPFKSVGAQYGQAGANDQVSLVNGFEAPEFGYIFVIASLVPEAAYSSGIDRHLFDLVNGNGVGDIPDAILQQVGPQEVFTYELDGDIITAVSISSPDAWRDVFGYQQRFAHYMEKRDQVHGLFAGNGQLKSFALQRNFTYDTPSLSSAFLMIPYTALNNVSAVNAQISQYGYWLDEYFTYHVSMPMAAYSIPTLENPAGEVEWIPKPGYTLN